MHLIRESICFDFLELKNLSQIAVLTPSNHSARNSVIANIQGGSYNIKSALLLRIHRRMVYRAIEFDKFFLL